MQDIDFKLRLGSAVIEVWGDIPRHVQEAIFELSVRDAPDVRSALVNAPSRSAPQNRAHELGYGMGHFKK
jgi:hypothetical protein